MDDLRTKEAWETIHQPFELGWWKEALANGHTGDPEMIDEVRKFIGPQGNIIDIGSGPRPSFAPCVVIEPLALEYAKIAPPEWWTNVKTYPVPAEQTILELVGTADTVICWNCIDHTIGWRGILDNMVSYGKPGAKFAIATDFYPPFIGHPGFPREEFMAEIDQRFTTIDSREPFGRHLALLMTARVSR